jgi:hypothetical protein
MILNFKWYFFNEVYFILKHLEISLMKIYSSTISSTIYEQNFIHLFSGLRWILMEKKNEL